MNPQIVHYVHNILIVHFGVGYTVSHAVNHAMASPLAIERRLIDWAFAHDFNYAFKNISRFSKTGVSIPEIQILFPSDDYTEIRILFHKIGSFIELYWNCVKNTYMYTNSSAASQWYVHDEILNASQFFQHLDSICADFCKST